MVSIIIRAKNEQKWIDSCLEGIFRQRYRDFEVILVDNCSTDKTVERAKNFNVKVVTIEHFSPGRAINLGVNASSGDFFVSISAHCIPVNEFWLENLLRNFNDPEVAGVYGRQEPMAFTNDMDKRDLINIFGLDRKVQKRDVFFHNANSMIRRDVWEKFPLDEEVANIEDRVWAKQILEAGYKIIYEPEASVFHYHGINQGGNTERAKGVVRILEQIHPISKLSSINGLNIIAIIPVCGDMKVMNGQPLIKRAIASAKKSSYVNRVVVASDNKEHLDVASEMGAEGILRPKNLSLDYIELVKVYQYVLGKLAEKGESVDILVLIEEIYPFRPPWIIDRMVENLIYADYDSVIAACPEYSTIWRSEGDTLVNIDSGTMPTKFKEPVYKGLIGLGCVTHPNVILEGNRLGKKIGLIKIDDSFSHIAIHNEADFMLSEALEPKWEKISKDSTKNRV
ncbi:MAG: glycosyltransferase family 2 protein [Candidatus Omnitrophota bacterium]|nr:glycosyltransferase family 2 protein [Candidatus Omnitrophota bacterium]